MLSGNQCEYHAAELLDCPHCGGKGQLKEYDGEWWIDCLNGCQHLRRDKNETIEAWNKRSPE